MPAKKNAAFSGRREQADSVQRDPLQREIANVDDWLAKTARHGERCSV